MSAWAPPSPILQTLSPEPVLGVNMAPVRLLRLDQLGGLAPGNKSFKLAENLARAREQGIQRLVSFGGAWSNHLHALAAVGREQGFATYGLVRGERPRQPSAMLCDASAWGMTLEYLSRTDYRQRNNPDFQAALQARLGPCLIIPEGGANAAGVSGCAPIARLLLEASVQTSQLVLAVGTGTTLAGLVAALPAHWDVLGISVLKGALDLEQQVQGLLAPYADADLPSWRISHDDHCGGYARVSGDLKAFMLEFERVQGVPLDPVYTGKVLYALYRQLQQGSIDGEIVAVHTGGLQGRRGFDWLGGQGTA
jgi:1-aminocyclopropane-1-carboxylate deaminase/D-cysteine desulfhydrase-like pyridoxal-dependent ACC family enzyme